MARIVFCWELGRGLGHLVPHLELIRRLVARGDDIVFLAKEAARAQSVFRGQQVTVRPLAHGVTAPGKRMSNADSFPEVVFNCGFDDVDKLYERVRTVLRELEALQPDIIIGDFAPSVMLANVLLKRPLIAVGSSFWMPPRMTPMPRFRYWLGAAPAGLYENELKVLGVINGALERLSAPPLESFAELLSADRDWLCVYEELDVYSPRPDAEYLGTSGSSAFGERPVWPDSAAPRIFAYLAPGSTTPLALAALAALDVAVCLYAPRLDDAQTRALDPDKFRIAAAPVSMPAVSGACAAFVNNGNLSTVATGLLAGKPQLCLPLNAEQYLNARRVELAGAGLAAPQLHPGDVVAKLRSLLHEPAYARAAGRFAAKYAGSRPGDRTQRMLCDIDALLSGVGA